ncbi:hypothetical protein FRC12_007226 [Ceratobasidium sp. 428]|nr:hypothetical protein FRC12_007226 [Ceratobasidium sp. 428]
MKFGNVYGTWMYNFERANRFLININLNGHGHGTLEATMARGFLRRAEAYRLVHYMQSILNPSDDDLATIEALLKVMRDGPEHKVQRGRLNAILAGDARFCEQGKLFPFYSTTTILLVCFTERVQFSTTPAKVNFRRGDDTQYYDLFVNFLSLEDPDIIVYGDSVRPDGGIYLDPKTSTISYSHFFYFGIRYGAAAHHRGKRSRYGFIGNRVPVIIRKIYQATLLVQGEPRRFVGIIVQRFVRPHHQPAFPWNNWADQLGIGTWMYNRFDEPEVVHPNELSGVFALSDIQLTYSHYWITFAMPHTEPKDLADDLD